jgi:hypothetical protein
MKIGKLGETLRKHLSHCIANTIHLPFLIIGPPGIGKTEIAQWAVKEAGHDIFEIELDKPPEWLEKLAESRGSPVGLAMSHPVCRQDVDYAGHPTIDPNTGEAEHKPYGELRQWLTATKPLVVFLDDLGQASKSVQAALMQVVRERTINGFRISPFVHFILATNGAADKAGVSGILRPLLTRCASVVVEADPEALVGWLKDNHSDTPEVAGFVDRRPEYVTGEKLAPEQIAGKIGAGYPTPRTITMCCDFIRIGYDHDTLRAIVSSTVGEGFSAEFCGWVRVWKQAVSYDMVIADPSGARLPGEVSAKYAQVTMLAYHSKRKALDKVVQYVDRIGGDFVSYFWNLVERTRKDLMETRSYIDYRNSQSF